jgi:hypothetical protein
MSRAILPDKAGITGLAMLVVTPLGLWWLWFSFVLFTFKCDDTCSEGEANQWAYTGQFIVVVFGCFLAVIALVLGLRSKTRASFGFALAALGCALFWFALVGDL